MPHTRRAAPACRRHRGGRYLTSTRTAWKNGIIVDERTPRPNRYLAQTLVIVLGLACVALAHRGALDAGITGVGYIQSPGELAPERRLHRDFEAIRAEFTATVPPGSRVVIDPPLKHLWHQRLAEFTAMTGSTLVTNRREADFQASLIERRTTTGSRFSVELREIS